MTMNKADRDALRVQHEAATPGPYYVYQNDLIGGWCAMNCDMPPSLADYRQGQLIVADFISEADARWYVTAHNALPELLDAEERAERYEAALRDAAMVLQEIYQWRVSLPREMTQEGFNESALRQIKERAQEAHDIAREALAQPEEVRE